MARPSIWWWITMAVLVGVLALVVGLRVDGTGAASSAPPQPPRGAPGGGATPAGAPAPGSHGGSTGGTGDTGGTGEARSTPGQTGPAGAAASDLPTPAATTLVATTDGAVPGSPAPGAPPDTTVPGSWYGYPSILPVIERQRGWLEVRLAQRPNGSTTWVQRRDVTLGHTPYFLVVDLTTMHLYVYENGTEVLDFPAGIGSPQDPTPTGDYFVTMTVPPPNPSYGPFVLATSDHSDTITDWQESGDAIIGIHGPITPAADARIGTTGAAISFGCIRLHDADLSQLADIPPGTPLDIVG